MKINTLILAIPVLCFACGGPTSDPKDPALQLDVTPELARHVSGALTLTTDANYDEPCNILGEEYIRGLFKLEEATKLEEGHHHNGCDFAWAGNKVEVAFGGAKPYSSIYLAEYQFDKMYQAKPEAVVEAPVEEADAEAVSGPSTEGTNAETPSKETKSATTEDNQPTHSGESAATPPLTEHAVSTGNYEAVSGVGDKAVWDASTGAMHVLYNNHIISVTVETKDKPEVKKEHAQNLTEVLIEKITANEYTRRL
ncbi:hypothetical protein [Spirosoma areae]